jgi:anti-anti-sigma factor
MALAESSSVIVSRRGLMALAVPDAGRRVVWVRGEHDVSTVTALSETLARAISLDDADLVVDLRGVQFMDAATVGVMVRARELLRLRSRCLVLRSPSRCARRVFGLCGLADLLDQRADGSPPKPGRPADRVRAGRAFARKVSLADGHHRPDERIGNVARGEGL